MYELMKDLWAFMRERKKFWLLLGMLIALAQRVGFAMRPYCVAHRLFELTKPRSARLVWPHCKANVGHPHSVARP